MPIETIASLTQGVSQQAPQLRRPEQGEDQVNAYSSVANGLQKRPPSVYRASLPGSPLAAYHLVDRPSGQYIVGVTGEPTGSVSVTTVAGVQQSVSVANPTYFNTDKPELDIRFLTISDSTFIVNRAITPQLDPASITPAVQTDHIVHIRGGREDTDYSLDLVVDGTEYSVQATTRDTITKTTRRVPRGGLRTVTTTTPVDNDTESIAERLGEALTAAGLSNEVFSSSVLITEPLIEQVVASDTSAGDLIAAVGPSVETIADLPPLAPDGFLTQVTGDGDTDQDNYWLRFAATDPLANLSEGEWIESAAPGTLTAFDPATMPQELRPEGTGFIVDPVAWVARTAGDADTVQAPSFVGQPIRDIGYWKGRLAFITEATAIFSASDDLFRFWPASATDLLDDDPVDLTLVSDFGGVLHGAAAFAEDFVCFSDREQFVIRGEALFTPATATATPATRLEAQDLRPVRVNSSAYFPFTRSGFTGYYQYFVEGESSEFQSEEITGHVPQYIPGIVRKHVASASEGLLAALSSVDRTSVYTYKWFDSGTNRLQSAWSRWEFSRPVLWVGSIDSSIYAILGPLDGEDATEAFLVEVDIADNLDIDVHLDRRVDEGDVTVSYDGFTNTSTITLPFDAEPEGFVMLAGSSAPSVEGRVIPTTPTGPRTFSVSDDWTGAQFFIGQNYTMLYEFSRPYIRQQSQSGSTSILSGGRLQLRRWRVQYADTGYFKTHTKVGNRPERVSVFSGKTLGTGTAFVGRPSISDGEFSWSVNSRNDELRIYITNDTPLPTNLTSASWEGDFVQRSR